MVSSKLWKLYTCTDRVCAMCKFTHCSSPHMLQTWAYTDSYHVAVKITVL